LSGIKVLDFSRFLPGPYCSLLLADFGADVIRVEQPHEVAKTRKVFGQDRFNNEQLKQAKAKEISSRNKRSILLDLKSDRALRVVKQLLTQVDVLVHDYRVGIMEEMGFGYEQVKAINPRLIYCAISVCGQTGPYRELAGHDPIPLALAGVLTRFGENPDEPRIAHVPVGDITAGTHAALGVMAALRARDQTGRGQLVDVAMSDCAFALMTTVYQRFLLSGHAPPPWRAGNIGLWKTRDNKFLCTTDLEPRFWERFCKAVGREEWIPRQFDLSGPTSIEPELADLFLTKTRDEWFALLRAADTQVAPVYSLAEALSDPHHRARGTVCEVVDPENPQSLPVTQIGPVIKLSDTPATVRHLAHLPGADTEQVLAELGCTPDDIAAIKPTTQVP
jgi:crotonobetainyl-CoA:carnitine CoA-transferase CaiB-like acyl-CoA transferase